MTDVLLLNLTFEPLRVIDWRTAVGLILRGVVEQVGECGTAKRVRTPHAEFQSGEFVVPTILRLRYYAHAPKRGATWSLHEVLKRDAYTCVYCGARPGDKQHGRRLTHADFSVDHLVPRCQGGQNTWTNTACACKSCNQRKGGRTYNEAGMKLLWVPKLPRVRTVVASGNVPAEWRLYLEL